jgi:hypothetical protein
MRLRRSSLRAKRSNPVQSLRRIQPVFLARCARDWIASLRSQ